MTSETPDPSKIELGARIGVPDGAKAVRPNTDVDTPLTPDEKARFEALLGPREKLPPPPPSPEMPTVLIAEDDPQMRAYFKTLMDSMRCDVIEAPNGSAALKILAERPISMLLLDLKLPEMDGFAVLRCTRTFLGRKTLPICVITSLQSPKDEAAAFRLGADDYILKPGEYERLVARFYRLLRRAAES